MIARPRRQTPKRAVSRIASAPPPVGGLNAVDALANMPVEDAITMENWFPQPNYVELRKGHRRYATGLPGWVETLMTYSSATAQKLFAVAWTGTEGKIYDASASGAVGAAVVTGLSDARLEYVNFGTAGGQFLYAANGTDKPQLYNGTTWTAIDGASTPAITGVTTTDLRSPAVWKSRLWFVQDDSLRAWYLPAASIGGAAQSIDLSSIFRLGGEMVAIVTATVDNANSLDDYLGFLSSEGELAVYAGTDPASSSTFQIVGVFRMGKPIGRRCYFRKGPDVVFITEDGLMPFSKLLMLGRVDSSQTLTYKILQLIASDVRSYRSNFGWEGTLFPGGSKLVVNVPQTERSVQYQYAMNLTTGAWCKFTGLNAACWEVFGDGLYFGGDGYVGQADYGYSDNGANITGRLKPAFQAFGGAVEKHFKMVRPVIQSNGTINAAIALNVDYGDQAPTAAASYSGTGGAVWNSALWDVSYWEQADAIQAVWQTVPGIGFAATVNMTAVSAAVAIKLQSIDYLYEPGGIL